jgi:hypothetical protein
MYRQRKKLYSCSLSDLRHQAGIHSANALQVLRLNAACPRQPAATPLFDPARLKSILVQIEKQVAKFAIVSFCMNSPWEALFEWIFVAWAFAAPMIGQDQRESSSGR